MICMQEVIPWKLDVQLDNTCRENKNKYVFSFFAYLVETGMIEEVLCKKEPSFHYYIHSVSLLWNRFQWAFWWKAIPIRTLIKCFPGFLSIFQRINVECWLITSSVVLLKVHILKNVRCFMSSNFNKFLMSRTKKFSDDQRSVMLRKWNAKWRNRHSFINL